MFCSGRLRSWHLWRAALGSQLSYSVGFPMGCHAIYGHDLFFAASGFCETAARGSAESMWTTATGKFSGVVGVSEEIFDAPIGDTRGSANTALLDELGFNADQLMKREPSNLP